MESIYIIDISIYLDLPARGTDSQMYRLSIERIISIWGEKKGKREREKEREGGGTDRRQTDGQLDYDSIANTFKHLKNSITNPCEDIKIRSKHPLRWVLS